MRLHRKYYVEKEIVEKDREADLRSLLSFLPVCHAKARIYALRWRGCKR